MINIHKHTHLIAIDLDGTLLKDDKTISAKSKRVLQSLINLGHIVVIATGRSNQMSIYYYQELGLTTPIINSNGAHIHHPGHKAWGHFHHPIDNKTALDVIDLSYQMQTNNIVATVKDKVFMDKHSDDIIQYLEQNKTEDTFSIGNLRDALKTDPTLLMIYPDLPTMDGLTKELASLHTEVVTYRNWGQPFHIIEVMSKGVNKASAIKQVANTFGIHQAEVIAFGDETNDLEMIEYAGIGVAMKNAADALKVLADQTTDSNEADGVANFLIGYFDLKI